MKHRMALVWSWLVMLATAWLPDAPPAMRFRGWLLGLFMRHRGRDFQVAHGVWLNGLENIAVGNHVYFAPGVILLAHRDITIDDEVLLAPYVVVADGNHTSREGSYRYGPSQVAPVHIGRGAWIAAHATIVAGVNIGSGSLVAANAAVTTDVPSGGKVAGVPARMIARRQSAA